MTAVLAGRRVAMLATDGVEQVQLAEARAALERAGATVDLLAPTAGQIQAFKHHDKADRFRVDRSLGDAHAGDYMALYLPGGVISADALRGDERAVQFVREMMFAGRPVAVIGHGAWLLVEADAVAGRTLTSWPSLRTDLRHAGAHWVDEPVHVDDELISGRGPADIAAFNQRMIAELSNRLYQTRADELSEASFPASDPPPGPSALGGGGAWRTAAPGRPGDADARS
ncbi:MAG TPA: type 1 glutamine amidotransferase domain-containing protein [Gemmatimonadaceae bacterium]|nr:type 1 glutamine amidotransferase domain-containing protein [Gemmatimonadaceae bacterium]